MAKSEEKLKSLFTRIKEETEIAGLKLYIKIRSWHPGPLYCAVLSHSVMPNSLQHCGL